MKFLFVCLFIPLTLFARYNESEWRDDIEDEVRYISNTNFLTDFSVNFLCISLLMLFISIVERKHFSNTPLHCVLIVIFVLSLLTTMLR